MYKRLLNPFFEESFFLFGARGVGKTSYLKEAFKNKEVLWVNLLKPNVVDVYESDPSALSQQIAAFRNKQKRTTDGWVIIDEVQKVPELLDVVHDEIEENQQKFALTGSSARKLKQKSANMLAGRAHINNLFPLTFAELNRDFNLSEVMTWGSLPKVINLKGNAVRKSFLNTYVNTYLKEEIVAEQLIRRVAPFKKFLNIVSQVSSTIVNFQNIADDLKVDWTTVRAYFEILEDTLLGFMLPAYDKSVRKQQLKSSKFYLFDIGVKRTLDRTIGIPDSGIINGPLFEQFIICEIHRLNFYYRTDYNLSYFATHGGAEVDLVIERPGLRTLFVEIKLSQKVSNSEINSLDSIVSENSDFEGMCLSREPLLRKVNKRITIYPWQVGIEYIFRKEVS